MKKALVLSLMLALICGLAVAKPMSFRVGGGLDIPEEGFSMGFHGMGGVEMAAGTNLSVLGTLGYHSIPWDTGGVDADIDPLTIISILAEGKYAFGKGTSAKPYVLGGLGFGSWSMTMPGYSSAYFTIPDTEISETDLIISLGVGVDINKIFVEMRYTMMDEFDNIPISVGVKF